MCSGADRLELALQPGSSPDPAEIQRTYQIRARVNQQLGNVRAQADDLSEAIRRLDDLDAIEATNPYLFAERAGARMKLRDWDGAADDALRAEVEFGSVRPHKKTCAHERSARHQPNQGPHATENAPPSAARLATKYESCFRQRTRRLRCTARVM